MLRISLLLVCAGLASFMLTAVLNSACFECNRLAQSLFSGGSMIFLCALGLIFCTGLIFLIQQTALLLLEFFSKTSRAQRRLLFTYNQWQQQHNLFELKKAKLIYNHRQKIKHLANKVNKN